MRLYQDFYDNFVPGDSGFPIMPQLIFVCEDEKPAKIKEKKNKKNKKKK